MLASCSDRLSSEVVSRINQFVKCKEQAGGNCAGRLIIYQIIARPAVLWFWKIQFSFSKEVINTLKSHCNRSFDVDISFISRIHISLDYGKKDSIWMVWGEV